MNLLSKETLVGAASLGAGAVIAKVVHKKVLPLIPLDIVSKPADDLSASPVQNLITLGVGIFTPMIVKNNIGKGLGAGMIAVSVAGLVTPLLSSAGVKLNGYSESGYMGEVLMGEADNTNGVLMGATENIFDAPSNDYSASGSGEAEF